MVLNFYRRTREELFRAVQGEGAALLEILHRTIEITELRSQMGHLSRERDAIKAQRLAAKFQCKNLRASINDLKTQKQSQETKIKDLEKNHKAAVTSNHYQLAKELAGKIDENNNALNMTEEKLRESTEEFERLTLQITLSKKKMKELKGEQERENERRRCIIL